MKIIFLNAYAGTVRGPLAEFIHQHKPDTDIFCFQETEGEMSALCDEVLGDYNKVTAHKFVTEKDDFYLTIATKDSLHVVSSGTIFGDQADIGLATYVDISLPGTSLHVGNFHGMSRPTDKSDTPTRVEQAKGLIDFFKGKEGLKIIGGDFNVFPQNPSLQQFQENGYRDLIRDFKITNTRNRLVWDRYPDNERQYYSDYIFTSDGVHAETLTAPDIEISDHLPLILEAAI